jgi:Mg2+ and Co2+ transporter CorA
MDEKILQDDHDDVTTLKERVNNISTDVNTIMTNHLPHLQDKVNNIERKQALWSGAIIILGIIFPYFLNLIFK